MQIKIGKTILKWAKLAVIVNSIVSLLNISLVYLICSLMLVKSVEIPIVIVVSLFYVLGSYIIIWLSSADWKE